MFLVLQTRLTDRDVKGVNDLLVAKNIDVPIHGWSLSYEDLR
jgi:hypothetical protein